MGKRRIHDILYKTAGCTFSRGERVFLEYDAKAERVRTSSRASLLL